MKIVYKCQLEIIDEFKDGECEGALPLDDIAKSIIDELMGGLSGNGTINITGATVEVI